MNKSVFKSIFYSIIFVIFFSQCTFDSMFYYPDSKPYKIEDSKFYIKEELFLKYKTSDSIHCLFAKVKNPKATILFLHGNAGNISHRLKSIEILTSNNYQVLIIDYPGYGKSNGKPSHQSILESSQIAFDYLNNCFDSKNTKKIILGRSIGGHLAVTIAKNNSSKVDALVIEGAFSSHREIGIKVAGLLKPFAFLLLKSKYPAIENIKELKMPKLIVHSTDDEVIPFEMSKKLFSNAKEPKIFFEIKGAHIRGIVDYPIEYIKKIDNLIGL